MEVTFTINDADLDKLNEILKDINVNECPWFEVQDKHGNKAKYYREPQWIPCTKEYPDPWELVWTTDRHGNVEVYQLSHKNSDWYDADENWFYNHDSIIAWMPYEAPEPYRPKEDES